MICAFARRICLRLSQRSCDDRKILPTSGTFYSVSMRFNPAACIPVDVQAMNIDYLSADGHKWMLGPEGLGFFYCRRGTHHSGPPRNRLDERHQRHGLRQSMTSHSAPMPNASSAAPTTSPACYALGAALEPPPRNRNPHSLVARSKPSPISSSKASPKRAIASSPRADRIRILRHPLLHRLRPPHSLNYHSIT